MTESRPKSASDTPSLDVPRASTAVRVVLRGIRRSLKHNTPGDMDSLRLWEALLAKHFDPRRKR